MMFPKSPRVKNEKIVDQLKKEIGYCEYCGSSFRLEAHHIKSRGAGGDDNRNNLIVLCHACHSNVHDGNILRDTLRTIITRRESRVK